MTEFFCTFAVCNKRTNYDNNAIMTNKKSLCSVLAMVAMFLSLPALVSCNKDKDDDDTTYSYSDSEQTTLIKGFALQADAEVLASLDSVHFTIDYDNGLIYNADSLPVGTDITALKVTVDFLNTVSSAVLILQFPVPESFSL